MIGADTTVLIDLYKKDAHIFSTLKENKEELILNDLTYLELTVGINTQKAAHIEEQALYDTYFDTFKTLPLTQTVAKKARDIIWNAKKQGTPIRLIDATIAAIYLSNNIKTILTRNAKDFKNIQGLQVITY